MIDINLNMRQYTWSNERDNPTFARLDRFFISPQWNMIFPQSIQQTLANTASDHVPILCECSSTFTFPNTFIFKIFGPRLSDFENLVNQTWTQIPTATDPKALHQKLTHIRKVIRAWKKERVGTLTSQKTISKEVIHWLDKHFEIRILTPLEKLTKSLIKDKFQQITILEEQMWKQQAKRQWIQEGDKNIIYFHAIASTQKQYNWISTI